MSMAIAEAIREGTLADRLWLYTNYHCNLTCSYCLTESSAAALAARSSPR